jgi:hypothetical protein
MRTLIFTFSILLSIGLAAQPSGGRTRGGQGSNMGHLYGKVVDKKTGKAIDGVSIQLLGNRFDSAVGKMSQATLKAAITPSTETLVLIIYQ